MPGTPPKALVILAEGAEEMEATVTIDVLRRGGVEVVVAGLDGADAVRCSRGVRIVPDVSLAEAAGDFDLVVLPGGAEGTRRLAESAAVGALLESQAARGGAIGAICAAPSALVRHGIGLGRAMTCHPSVEGAVGERARLAAGAVVADGSLVTSRGPGTSFEFALALVARLRGEEVARGLRAPMCLE